MRVYMSMLFYDSTCLFKDNKLNYWTKEYQFQKWVVTEIIGHPSNNFHWNIQIFSLSVHCNQQIGFDV